MNKEKILDTLRKLFVLTPGMKVKDVKDAVNFKNPVPPSTISPYEQNRIFFLYSNAKVNEIAAIVWFILGIFAVSISWAVAVLIWVAEAFLIFVSARRNISAKKEDVLNNLMIKEEEIKQEGLNRLGLDIAEVTVAVEPLSIVEYYFGDIVTPFKKKQNISSNIIVTYFYVGIHELYMYSNRCSIINQNECISESEEFFYGDIVSAGVKIESVNAKTLTFEVKLSNGDVKSYYFPNETNISQALMAIKNLIRDKRHN